MPVRKQWIYGLVVVMAATVASYAEPQGVGPGPQAEGRRMGRRPPFKGGPGARAKARGNMIDHLMSLSPEEQREFMRENPRFRSLPPHAKEQVRRRLDEFNQLPPGRREALREQYELFRRLTPEQQEQARALYRQWSGYPPGRRRELMREFRRLREAGPEDRRQRMESDEYRNRYSDAEQELLKRLVDLAPPEEPDPE